MGKGTKEIWRKEMIMTNWREQFRMFYNDNENGGSSRWRVSPDTIENFIASLVEPKKCICLCGEIDWSSKKGVIHRKDCPKYERK